MEESPKTPTQELVEKLELLSEERIEKHFPGLKREFDVLRDKRSSGALTEEAFWAMMGPWLDAHGVSKEKLDRILQER